MNSGSQESATEPLGVSTRNGIELMIRAAQGDPVAFGQVCAEYMSIVARYVAHHKGNHCVVEDVVQEVFVRVWQNRARYHPKAALSTYLCAYADRVLAEYRRAVGGDARLLDRLLASADRHTDNLLTDPCVLLCRLERQKAVRQVLAKLPLQQKEAVEAVYFHGYGRQEAARRAHCSVRALESRLKRARALLRSLLQSHW